MGWGEQGEDIPLIQRHYKKRALQTNILHEHKYKIPSEIYE